MGKPLGYKREGESTSKSAKEHSIDQQKWEIEMAVLRRRSLHRHFLVILFR